jgi:cytochrome c oxidase subunit II
MWIEGGSTYAPRHDLVMLWINIITIAAFLLVNAVLVYFIVRYRRRSANDKTSRIAHSSTIEVIWTVIPTIVFFALFGWGLYDFYWMRSVPANAREIVVIGSQWSWEFTYPAELRSEPEKGTQLKTTNVIYLEEGVPVKLVMNSPDVLHSFFVPAFRVKEDLVPGLYTYVSFTPLISPEQSNRPQPTAAAQVITANPGGIEHPALKQYCGEFQKCAEYVVYCTEYCGKDHSVMEAKAVVLPRAEFLAVMARIEKEAGDISPERGEAIYANNCRACHSLDGSRVVGPTFKGLWGGNAELEGGQVVPRDANYMRSSILNPAAQIVKGYPNAMPVQNLNDAQIASMIEYMKTLQ